MLLSYSHGKPNDSEGDWHWKDILCSPIPRGRGNGGAPGSIPKLRKGRWKFRTGIFHGVSVGRNRRDRTGRSRIGSLNNFIRLWGIQVLASCLVPDPEMVRVGGWWPLWCEPHTEVVKDVECALTGLGLKSRLVSEWLTVFRNWIALEQAALLGVSNVPGCKATEYANKKNGS